MKTKELIRQLQLADPDGESECVVNGTTDILAVEPEPGYYDGSYQVLVRNPDLNGECYDVIGGIISTKGVKINLSTHTLREAMYEAIMSDKEFPIEIQAPNYEQEYQETINGWKEEILLLRVKREVRRKR